MKYDLHKRFCLSSEDLLLGGLDKNKSTIGIADRAFPLVYSSGQQVM